MRHMAYAEMAICRMANMARDYITNADSSISIGFDLRESQCACGIVTIATIVDAVPA